MDLDFAVTALGTSFSDVGSKLTVVGIAAFTAVASTGLVFAALRFILRRFGINNASLNPNKTEWHGDGTLSDWGTHYESVKRNLYN